MAAPRLPISAASDARRRPGRPVLRRRALLALGLAPVLAVLTDRPTVPPAPGAAAAAADPEPSSSRSGAVEVPAAGARATLPLHVLARVGAPGEDVAAALLWDDGTALEVVLRALRGEDGRGLVVGTLDWPSGRPAPRPATQPAMLELRAEDGVLARQAIAVLGRGDPDTREVSLYWLAEGAFRPVPRRVVRTPRIATAALEELLWGPGPGDPPGLATALPTPQQVLGHAGRFPGWGPRVRVRGVSIDNGVATADFSEELAAYGGGSTRVWEIEQQVERTLRQFPGVRAVRIAIEGETEAVLQP